MEINMLPQGEGCQCAECRAERGDTQFAEFMDRADAYMARVHPNMAQVAEGVGAMITSLTESFTQFTECAASVPQAFARLQALIPDLDNPT